MATLAPTAPVAAPGQGTASKSILPTYVPFTGGPKADLPASDAGLQAGYFSYPRDLVKTVTTPPGAGGDVTAMVQTSTAPPTPLDQNPAWQEINRQLNANVKIQPVSSTDYRARVGTVMAGNDVPDLFFLSHTLTATGVPQFLKAAFTDLTPFVTGDAIKDYPNLAAFPTITWRQTIVDGAIYGVPVVRPSLQNVPFINQSRFEAAGVTQPSTADDFKRILQELTKPQSNQFGIGGLAPGTDWSSTAAARFRSSRCSARPTTGRSMRTASSRRTSRPSSSAPRSATCATSTRRASFSRIHP